MSKPLTIKNESTATPALWVHCFGHVLRANPKLWTHGMDTTIGPAICEIVKKHRTRARLIDAKFRRIVERNRLSLKPLNKPATPE